MDLPHGAFRSGVVAPVQATAVGGDAADENHSSPILFAHACNGCLGDDKLRTGVDFHHDIPVIFLNVLDVADTAADTGIGDENRESLMLSLDLRESESAGDKIAGIFARGKISRDDGKKL